MDGPLFWPLSLPPSRLFTPKSGIDAEDFPVCASLAVFTEALTEAPTKKYKAVIKMQKSLDEDAIRRLPNTSAALYDDGLLLYGLCRRLRRNVGRATRVGKAKT